MRSPCHSRRHTVAQRIGHQSWGQGRVRTLDHLDVPEAVRVQDMCSLSVVPHQLVRQSSFQPTTPLYPPHPHHQKSADKNPEPNILSPVPHPLSHPTTNLKSDHSSHKPLTRSLAIRNLLRSWLGARGGRKMLLCMLR